MATSLFGWDLLYLSVQKDIKKTQDLLVCLSHLVLISNGFKCIGLGESKTIDGSESKNEGLPKGWNEDYALRYVYQGRLYNFKATTLDEGVMINLIRVDERSVSFVQLNNTSVHKKTGTLEEMMPDYPNMVNAIQKHLIEKVIVSKKAKEAGTQTESQQPPRHPIDDRRGFPVWVDPDAVPLREMVPPQYGRSDLDPLGGLDPLGLPSQFPARGGGMIFPGPSHPQPPGNLGVAPGSVPPGARFDSFRPPESPDDVTGGRLPNRPDNDDLPPPGYEDMFQ